MNVWAEKQKVTFSRIYIKNHFKYPLLFNYFKVMVVEMRLEVRSELKLRVFTTTMSPAHYFSNQNEKYKV